MARPPIKFDNSQVHDLLSSYTLEGLRKLHPGIASIIGDTLDQQLPRKLSCNALLEVLQGCTVITVPAAAEATGFRYARSTTAEYAMLARIASKAIGDYAAASTRNGDAGLL